MKRRDNAILLGIGTTRRKFLPTGANTAGLHTRIPAVRYLARESGKLCRGCGNHKCLFNKGDTLWVLCPETVMEGDDLATVLIHREWNGKDMLMQRNFHDYRDLLEYEGECGLDFPVVQVGRLTYGGSDEFLCVQPAQGTNLWVDRRLTLPCENATTTTTAVPGDVNVQEEGMNEDNSGVTGCELECVGYWGWTSDGLGYGIDFQSYSLGGDEFI